jgi:hypothetical protein
MGSRALAILVGRFLPIRLSGRFFLIESLREVGIEPGRLPRALLDEIVRDCAQHAQLMTRMNLRADWRVEVVSGLRDEALLISYALSGGAPDALWEELAMPKREMLARYGIESARV